MSNTNIASRHRYCEPVSSCLSIGLWARSHHRNSSPPPGHFAASDDFAPTQAIRNACTGPAVPCALQVTAYYRAFCYQHSSLGRPSCDSSHMCSPPLRPLFIFRLDRLQRLLSPAIGARHLGHIGTPPPPPLLTPFAYWCPAPHYAFSFSKEKFQYPKTVKNKPPIVCRRSRTQLKSCIFAARAVTCTRCALLRPSSSNCSFSFCKKKRHSCRKHTLQHTTNNKAQTTTRKAQNAKSQKP